MTSTNSNRSAMRRTASSSSAYERRTKSVHEIAWSKFDATKEAGMEELQNKEREVLEEEVRSEIMAKFQGQYEEQLERQVARARAELQQSIREEIRAEFDEFAEHNLRQSAQVDEEQIEREKQEMQRRHERQLEAEREKMR